MYKTLVKPRRLARKHHAVGRHLLNLWLDGVSVNFYLDSETFAAMEQWQARRHITNRTHAVRVMIAATSAKPADPYGRDLLEYLDRWRVGEGISTRTKAIRAIIRRAVMKQPEAQPQPREKRIREARVL